MVYDWIDFIQFSFFAPKCILCGAKGSETLDLCPGCRGDLLINQHPCPHCAAPLPPHLDSPPAPCGECQQATVKLDQSLTPYLFSYPLSQLISRFKFHGQLFCGRLLSHLLGDYIGERQNPWPELIIPVPLHTGRLRERGFNQALELARPLARRFNIPLDRHSIHRIRATPQQAQLSRNKRIRNMRGAFEIVRPIHARHVVLVDDVITTGSTVRELARILREAGIERVDCWAVARTPKL